MLLQIIKRELLLLLARTGFFLVATLFSAAAFMLFRFSLPASGVGPDFSTGILWAVHLIAALFILLAQQEWETEWQAARIYRLKQVPAYLVFVAKSSSVFIALALLWVFEQLLFNLFFLPPNPGLPMRELALRQFYIFIAAMAANAGIAMAGQLAASVAVHSRFRHVLLLVIFFPLAIPALVAGSSLSRAALQGVPFDMLVGSLNLEIAFLFLYAAAGIALYGILWEE